MWSTRVEDGELVLYGERQPKCYLCGHDYVMWKAQKLKFGNSRAIDVEMVCENCHLEAVFGVAVSQDEYDHAHLMELSIKNER